MVKGKRYSKDFKLGAVRPVVEDGYTFWEVAKRLGTAGWAMRQWVQKFGSTGAN